MEKALTGLVAWVDARLPITRAGDTHMGSYYAPKNFNLWYFLAYSRCWFWSISY